MRGWIERTARRWWAGELGVLGGLLTVALAPLSWLWRAVTAVRNRRFEAREAVVVSGLAVVSVGNLAVGGTGKTPLASWIARRLRAAGRGTTILLSGYGADEALLHATWTPEVQVLSCQDRTAGARAARSAGAEVAVLDDGFQHRRLHRDLDIVLLALEDRFPGRVLPCGPYREGPGALVRADAVVITRRSGSEGEARQLAERVERLFPGLVKGSVHLAAGPLVDPKGRETDRIEGDALALTAIGRPGPFLASVARYTVGRAELLSFADHHDYTPADFAWARDRAGARPIVVTEKDAVKLERLEGARGQYHVLRQGLRWDWGEDAVAALLDGVAARVDPT